MPFIITPIEYVGLFIGLWIVCVIGYVVIHYVRKHW
ncbi:hypothetical protein ES708_29739 [subsurface metagenome]